MTPGRLRRRARAGFTLIEILVVVVIIGLLAGISINNFHNAQDKARIANLQTNIRTLGTGLELYASDNNGSYPDPLQGEEFKSDAGGLLRNQYLNSANTWPKSPWGGQIQSNHLTIVTPPLQPASAVGGGTPIPTAQVAPAPVIPPGVGSVATTTTFLPTNYGAIFYDFDPPTTTWVLYGIGKSGSKPVLSASRSNGGGN